MSWTNPFATQGSVVDQYARNVALTADTNATSALSIVGTANTNATSALNLATSATTTANTAQQDASSAKTNATSALNLATSATTTANTAQQDATSALNLAGNALSTSASAYAESVQASQVANSAVANAATAQQDATKALESLPLCMYSQTILTPDILGTYEPICSVDIITLKTGFISVNATSVYTNLTNSHKNILYYLEIETEMGQEHQALLHNQISSQLVVSANFTTAGRVVGGTYHIALYAKCLEGDTNVLAEITTLNAIGHLY